jgi:hypothetical protein
MTDKSYASLYQLSTGPIFDRRRAEDIVNQLLAAGLSANVSIEGQATLERFRVVSEILLPSVAQHRVAGLADLHPEQQLLDDGRLKLQFGTFSTEQGRQPSRRRSGGVVMLPRRRRQAELVLSSP